MLKFYTMKKVLMIAVAALMMVACSKEEMNKEGAQFGFISVDRNGSWWVGQTKGVKAMYAAYNGKSLKLFR